jgi:trans-2,3-dihydro-3-hydroxyanthranilate isomerase
VGPTPVDIDWEGSEARFVWMNQQRPVFGPVVSDLGLSARAVGVSEKSVAQTGMLVQEVSCGVPFVFIPVATRAAVDEAAPDVPLFQELCRTWGLEEHAMFVFSPEPGRDDATIYSRMFAPGLGIYEDPATGSASGPLGCYLVRHGIVTADRASAIVSLQGVKMGRPSWIHIDIGVEGQEITRVRVGGKAVLVAEGEIGI